MAPDYDIAIEEIEPVLTPVGPLLVVAVVVTAVASFLAGKSDGGGD